jgi:hypothetical protein
MKSTNHAQETQQDSAKITGAIDRFFQNFHLATILNQSGIRKKPKEIVYFNAFETSAAGQINNKTPL